MVVGRRPFLLFLLQESCRSRRPPPAPNCDHWTIQSHLLCHSSACGFTLSRFARGPLRGLSDSYTITVIGLDQVRRAHSSTQDGPSDTATQRVAEQFNFRSATCSLHLHSSLASVEHLNVYKRMWMQHRGRAFLTTVLCPQRPYTIGVRIRVLCNGIFALPKQAQARKNSCAGLSGFKASPCSSAAAGRHRQRRGQRVCTA